MSLSWGAASPTGSVSPIPAFAAGGSNADDGEREGRGLFDRVADTVLRVSFFNGDG